MKALQTKHIPDVPVLERILAVNRTTGGWAMIFEDCPESVVPGFPPGTPRKLIQSKLRSLIRRGLIDGCGCGCRGDLMIKAPGLRALLLAKPDLFPYWYAFDVACVNKAAFAPYTLKQRGGSLVEAGALLWRTLELADAVFVGLSEQQLSDIKRLVS